jgi:hypothetical protein
MRLSEITALTHDKDKAIKQGQKLSFVPDDEERKAINWYKDGGYDTINPSLRYGEDVPPDTEQMLTDHGFDMNNQTSTKHLDNVIAKAPKRKKIIYAFRGERSEYHTNKLLGMEVGESFTELSFVSASLSASYAYYAFSRSNSLGLLSKFIIPPSFPAAYISDGPEHLEMEILLARNTTFILKEKRTIPNKDRKHFKNIPITLLIWDLKPKHIDV